MAYAETDELFRILKLNRSTPSDEQVAAAERVLDRAAYEIDSYIDLGEGVNLSAAQLAVAEDVNLKRAAELWEFTPFGMFSAEGFAGAERTARDSFARYTHDLAPLKDQQGFA